MDLGFRIPEILKIKYGKKKKKKSKPEHRDSTF
jgi:hypothetical protein